MDLIINLSPAVADGMVTIVDIVLNTLPYDEPSIYKLYSAGAVAVLIKPFS